MAILLGFDTGGTYTDAVIYCEDRGVLESSKALTTKSSLIIGLRNALDKLSQEQLMHVRLVSLSTTLATNAIVETHATPAALILIGQDERTLSRAGLGKLVADGPVVFIDGGHTCTGKEVTSLDLDAVKSAIRSFDANVEAYAVVGYFSVRNPSHEIQVRSIIRETTHKPVTCSHELSSNLDAPRRALTTLINARLISLLQSLIFSVKAIMEERSIQAPLMVVRGDGSLISATSALERPVETILSGPAASVIGASHLSGKQDGIVSDIGGTTTDVILFKNGRPNVNKDGAVVGGWRTMVEAVNVRTFGLGGDSEVRHDEYGEIFLGPRRVIPISLLASEYKGVTDLIEKQLVRPVSSIHDGRFAVMVLDPENSNVRKNKNIKNRINKTESEIFEKLRKGPTQLHEISAMGMGERILLRLVNEGRVIISAFTPSDASHVLGKQNTWSTHAAKIGATLYIRRLLELGHYDIANDAESFSQIVFERVVAESAKRLLESILAEIYHIKPDVSSSHDKLLLELIVQQRGKEKEPSKILDFFANLNIPLIAIGAPAATYYSSKTGVASRINASLISPPHADVANAIGAVVGSVKGDAEALITEPETGRFRVHTDLGIDDFISLEEAELNAMSLVQELSKKRAFERGASEVDTTTNRDERKVEIAGGGQVFIECKISATSRGRPDLATHFPE